MEKFRYVPKKEVVKSTKRADNVKIVNIPGQGKIYVCPYPPEHYDELVAERNRILAKK